MMRVYTCVRESEVFMIYLLHVYQIGPWDEFFEMKSVLLYSERSLLFELRIPGGSD